MSTTPRKFDWDEAKRRHDAGETYAALARHYGVHHSSVRRACDPALRARAYANSARSKTPERMAARRKKQTALGLGFMPRDRYGVVVTAREQSTRQFVTITEAALVTVALKACVARLERMEGDWKVVTISTPRTIISDLQGTRQLHSINRDADARAGIEDKLLGHIKRMDMLEPRLRSYPAHHRVAT